MNCFWSTATSGAEGTFPKFSGLKISELNKIPLSFWVFLETLCQDRMNEWVSFVHKFPTHAWNPMFFFFSVSVSFLFFFCSFIITYYYYSSCLSLRWSNKWLADRQTDELTDFLFLHSFLGEHLSHGQLLSDAWQHCLLCVRACVCACVQGRNCLIN